MASTKRDPYAISEDFDPSTELQGEKVIFDDFDESVEYFLTILEIQSTHQLLYQSTSLDQYITSALNWIVRLVQHALRGWMVFN